MLWIEVKEGGRGSLLCLDFRDHCKPHSKDRRREESAFYCLLLVPPLACPALLAVHIHDPRLLVLACIARSYSRRTKEASCEGEA